MTAPVRSVTRGFDLVHGLLAAMGLAMLGLACLKRWSLLHAPLGYFDEGVLLTNTDLLLKGQFPFRDFYSIYPPGIYFLLAAVWKVVGISIISERALAVAIFLVLAALVGRNAGLIAGRGFSRVAFGLAALRLCGLANIPFAFLTAELTLLFVIELMARARAKPALALGAGVLLGVVSWFRHDLVVYFGALSLVVVAAGLWFGRRDARLRALDVPTIGLTLAVGVLTALLLWIPTLLIGGPRNVWMDLVYNVSHYIMPVRKIPFPSMLANNPILGVPTPAILTNELQAGILLAFLGPLAGFFILRENLRVGDVSLRAPLVVAFSIAALPQLSARTDLAHVVQSSPASVILLSALLERSALGSKRAGWLAALAFGALALPVCVTALGAIGKRLRPEASASAAASANSRAASNDAAGATASPTAALAHGSAYIGLPREGGIPQPDAEIAAARREVARAVFANTRPNEPIFVGASRHDRVVASELDLYFLLDRTGGTRYLQFDPNLESRADVQREMIADFERRKLRLVVLSTRNPTHPHPNDVPGSSLLDDYLAAHFRPIATASPYSVLMRQN